ncbi:M20/M25/M40 family metallo-hydrolase [candidate division KSB1 bacterium]|nr:M20/M25/M40 family metallo-hydrolase [candidate division KSB1 bacterium]
MSKSNIPQELKKLFPKEVQESLIRLRRHLHQNPELSFKEERTSQKLYEELAQLNPVELIRVAGTGVVARIKGRNPGGLTVAVRGDIDALPIQEATGLEFASQNDGVMHACGHDVHAT